MEIGNTVYQRDNSQTKAKTTAEGQQWVLNASRKCRIRNKTTDKSMLGISKYSNQSSYRAS